MGILNVTPDSFRMDGKFDSLDAALFHAEEMVNQGADILDVGGESTRPGHIQITEDEEIARVTPVIEQLKNDLTFRSLSTHIKAELRRRRFNPVRIWSMIYGD